MLVIFLQALGWAVFLAGSIALGTWLRKNPSKQNAEKTSRVLHFLYWVGAGLGIMGIFYPGLTHYDELVGIASLPFRPGALVLGALLLLAGTYFTVASQIALRRLGDGANAFRLTKRLVAGNIYHRMRNPMSLGFYLNCVGLGLVAGSTYLTLGSLLGVIPTHVFYLKTFEELELALRLGQPYVQYKQRVPFLIPRLTARKTRDG